MRDKVTRIHTESKSVLCSSGKLRNRIQCGQNERVGRIATDKYQFCELHRSYEAHQRYAPNCGAGNIVLLGLIVLILLVRQHKPDVQFASAPLANPIAKQSASDENRHRFDILASMCRSDKWTTLRRSPLCFFGAGRGLGFGFANHPFKSRGEVGGKGHKPPKKFWQII